MHPGVAQLGRALALGARCRRFESCRPDHSEIPLTAPFPPCGENCAGRGISSFFAANPLRWASPRGDGEQARSFHSAFRCAAVPTSIVFRYYTSEQTPYRLRRLFMLRIKSHLALIPLLLLSKPNPLRWASVWLEKAWRPRYFKHREEK